MLAFRSRWQTQTAVLGLFVACLNVDVLIWFATELWESAQQLLANLRIEQKASHYETRGFAMPGLRLR